MLPHIDTRAKKRLFFYFLAYKSFSYKKFLKNLSKDDLSCSSCVKPYLFVRMRPPVQKGIHLYAVKGRWQLEDSLQSKMMAMVFAMAAAIERDLISQRTKEALRLKKASGMPLGRPRGPGKSKLDPYQPEITALLANGATQKFIAKRYGTTEGNLHTWLKKRGLKPVKV